MNGQICGAAVGRRTAGRVVGTHLLHGEIPVVLYPPSEVYQAEGDHPILHFWRVGIEGENLEFNRVELVNRNRGFRVRIQVFVQLLKNGVDLVRRLVRRQKRRFFLSSRQGHIRGREGGNAHFTRLQYSTHFPHNGLIAAEVGAPFEDKT